MAMISGSSCPGSKLFKEVKPEYFECPNCHNELEMWTDEPVIRCKHCGSFIRQKRGASCIDWCRYAKECVGVQKYERLRQDNQFAEALEVEKPA